MGMSKIVSKGKSSQIPRKISLIIKKKRGGGIMEILKEVGEMDWSKDGRGFPLPP